MKRTALIVFLLALAFVSFYSAYAPEWSRRYIPLPIKNNRGRSTAHVLFGTVFLMGVFLLIWAAVMSES